MFYPGDVSFKTKEASAEAALVLVDIYRLTTG
jgi:hypothetical protein